MCWLNFLSSKFFLVYHQLLISVLLPSIHKTFTHTSGLNLSDYALNTEDPDEPIYDLFAVSNHFGGMGGGHCKLIDSLSMLHGD